MSSVQGLRCRRARAEDLPFLEMMLGEVAVCRPDRPTPTGDEVLADVRYAMCTSRADDSHSILGHTETVCSVRRQV